MLETIIIPQGDVYIFVAKSELPGADEFKSWIFDDVLVSISKNICKIETNMLLLCCQNNNKVLMKFSEFERLLIEDGWYIKTTKKHKKYVHPTKKGFIPVGKHKSQEIPKGTLESMIKRAGLNSH